MLTEIHGWWIAWSQIWFPRSLAPIYEQGFHRGVTKEQLRATNSFVKYKSPTCPSSQFVEHKLTVWGKREFPCKFKAIHERLLTRGISTCKKSIVLPDLHCTLISLGLSGSQQKEDPSSPSLQSEMETGKILHLTQERNCLTIAAHLFDHHVQVSLEVHRNTLQGEHVQHRTIKQLLIS